MAELVLSESTLMKCTAAVAILVLLTLSGGTMGYVLAGPPMRTAEAVIQLTPQGPSVAYGSDDGSNGATKAARKKGKQAQAVLVTSQRVMRHAMDSTAWRKLEAGNKPTALPGFAKALRVESPRRADVLSVRFKHTNPEVAKTGVEAVTQAYLAISADGQAPPATSGGSSGEKEVAPTNFEPSLVRRGTLHPDNTYRRLVYTAIGGVMGLALGAAVSMHVWDQRSSGGGSGASVSH